MGASVANRIREHLSARRLEMVEFLTRLVEAESPTVDPDSQRVPQRLLAERLESLDFHVRHYPGETSGGMLLARPAGRVKGDPIQVLIGHCDTVWPSGTIADMPASLEDGRLYGPGSFDMKGGLVEIVYAVETLRDLDLRPTVAPIVLVTSDEETGSRDSWRLIERLAGIADRAFILEPALGPDGRLKTARKGNGQFLLRVHGRAAHAGLEPEKGASAILELSLCIQQLFELNDPDRGITVNVGTIDGGLRTNVVAPTSEATIDVRILHAADAPRIEQAIRALQARTPGTELEITGGINRLPMERTRRNRRLWHSARSSAELLGLDIEEGVSGGGSDGNITSLHCATLDGLGPVGDGAHAIHEHVKVDSIPDRAALLAMLLLEPSLGGDESSEAALELEDSRPVVATAGPDPTVRGPTAT
jgi:glutamate carboxypeptidase